MAYATGSATSIADLLSQLNDFATGLTTTPWTAHDGAFGTTPRLTLNRGDCFASFYVPYNVTSSLQHGMAIYQSTGWSAVTYPYQLPGDSGNGTTLTTVTTGRRVQFTDGTTLTAGPYSKFHFFASEGATPTIYIVVETVAGVFRHFGFGHLVKANDFTGGEFAYGHAWATAASSFADVPTNVAQSFLLDGYSTEADSGTMRLIGMPGQAVDSTWGVFKYSGAPANDRAGKTRVQLMGGARCGFWGYKLGHIRASAVTAHKLLLPVPVIMRNDTTTPDSWRWLGHMPDIGLVNMHNFAKEEVLSIGEDDYMVFPWVRKQYLQANTEESWNAGVAYRVIV